MAVQLAHLFGCNACHGEYRERQRDGTVYHHACPPLRPDKNGIEAERRNKRDENVVYGLMDRVIGIRSEGDGVTCLSDARLSEPAWITAMKERIAKQEEE
jgi:hypothetical protein